MKLLLYPEILKNNGTGNVLRMYYLYSFLIVNKLNDVSLKSNNDNLMFNIISSLGGKIFEDSSPTNEKYDVIIYDSPIPNSTKVDELRGNAVTLIALDFFEYDNQNIDKIINLYSHNRAKIPNFKGEIYEGTEYAILKEDVLGYSSHKKKVDNSKIKILITFGGEDPNSNTIRTLQCLDKIININIEISVVIGYLNKDKDKILQNYSKKINLIYPTPELSRYISENDIVICGGGTTLLEAIYIGNPVVCIPQNKREEAFFESIKKRIPLFIIDELIDLLEYVNTNDYRNEILNKYRNYLDGKGKGRIEDIICFK